MREGKEMVETAERFASPSGCLKHSGGPASSGMLDREDVKVLQESGPGWAVEHSHVKFHRMNYGRKSVIHN